MTFKLSSMKMLNNSTPPCLMPVFNS